jgi:hypothetical protein
MLYQKILYRLHIIPPIFLLLIALEVSEIWGIPNPFLLGDFLLNQKVSHPFHGSVLVFLLLLSSFVLLVALEFSENEGGSDSIPRRGVVSRVLAEP